VTVPVIENVDHAVGGLKSIRIRNSRAIIEQQTVAPGLAIIGGKEAVMLDRRGRRRSMGPFFTRIRFPEARRRMKKKRALTF